MAYDTPTIPKSCLHCNTNFMAFKDHIQFCSLGCACAWRASQAGTFQPNDEATVEPTKPVIPTTIRTDNYKTSHTFEAKTKCQTLKVTYSTAFERAIYMALEADPEVVSWVYDPRINIPCIDGAIHRPRLLVAFANGDLVLADIIPSGKLWGQEIQEFLEFATYWCDDRGFNFEVWSEKDNPWTPED
jgi:hypothetical protein